MSPMANLITSATGEMRSILDPAVDRDWSVVAGDVDWSCWQTAAHIADDLFSYASQVVAQPLGRYLPVEAAVDADATPEDLLYCIEMCGELLRLAVSAAPATARGWHPHGLSDPDGFAAMGVAETVVHTYDITVGLGLKWSPPAELSAAVLARLFPQAPAGDPSAVLLWCTGRTRLADRPRLEEWRWDCSVRERCRPARLRPDRRPEPQPHRLRAHPAPLPQPGAVPDQRHHEQGQHHAEQARQPEHGPADQRRRQG